MSDTRQSRLQVRADPALAPDCPHCDKPLSSILATRIRAVGPAPSRFGKRFAYACPNCNKLLAITHRKGFWMG